MAHEKRIETAIRKHIAAHGGISYKLHGNAVQGAGLPDLMGGYRGRPFLVEVKAPDGHATPLQLATLRRLAPFGYVVGVVASVADFVALFEEA